MKKRDFVIIGLVAIVGFFIGTFFFSINSRSGDNISSNECGWENIYQGLFGSSSVYRDVNAGSKLVSGGFVIHLEISYDKIEFTKIGVIASTTGDNTKFFLNDIDCGTLGMDTFFLNDFTNTCLSVLKEGFNTFNSSDSFIYNAPRAYNYSKSDAVIHEIYVGMKYKPSNCDQ